MKRPSETHQRPPPTVGDRFALLFATGFGAGYAPVASGTFGTLVGIPVLLLVARLDPWLQLVTTLGVISVAVLAGDRAGRYFGASDDGRIVSDEIAGFLVTMALVPISVKTVVVGFLLFRVFDILKPWPARYFDKKVHTGFGNVMDDVCAGLFARALMALLVWYWP